MGNGYNPHLHHHQNLNQRSMFLPMLCSRPSIKDVHLPKWKDQRLSSSGDPSSPKVTCIGQVKRKNRVTGYPTSRFVAPDATTNHHIKYSKLKRLFSAKNLTSTSTSATTGGGGGGAISCRREIGDNYVQINVLELDPPLPVTKRVQDKDSGRDVVDLWKRRSGGMALKRLQIQQIQVPNNHFLQPTTV